MIDNEKREFLRHLIDVVWNHVHEDESVPATSVADELIDKAVASQIEETEPSTKLAENKRRLRRLRTLSFSDLKALETQCNEKMNYQQRRFPKDRKRHKEIYKEQYEIWLLWFSLYNAVLLAMDEYVENLKK